VCNPQSPFIITAWKITTSTLNNFSFCEYTIIHFEHQWVNACWQNFWVNCPFKMCISINSLNVLFSALGEFLIYKLKWYTFWYIFSLSMFISRSNSLDLCVNQDSEHWAMSTTNVFVCLCLCLCVYVQWKSQTRPSLSECSSCLLFYWARMYYLAIFLDVGSICGGALDEEEWERKLHVA